MSNSLENIVEAIIFASELPVKREELVEVIAEFERYRERLVNETMAAAQKAKLPQKAAMAKIEPELAKIDAGLDSLRTQLAAITTNN